MEREMDMGQNSWEIIKNMKGILNKIENKDMENYFTKMEQYMKVCVNTDYNIFLFCIIKKITRITLKFLLI